MQDLTARYGGFLSLSITTPVGQELQAAAFVQQLSSSAKRVYALAGTQRFEVPVNDVSVSSVFSAVEAAKEQGHLDVLDWGVSNASLEEVFVKIMGEAGVHISALT